MQVTLFGFSVVDFVADDGRAVKGVTLYYGYETTGVTGLKADKVFVSADKVSVKDLVAGADATIVFDNRGRAVKVVL